MKKTTVRKGATSGKPSKSVIDRTKHDNEVKFDKKVFTDEKAVIVSIINQKGGVGKSTTTLNLGAGLADIGLKVLIVDLDIQCNLTHMAIGDIGEGQRSICEAMLEGTGFDDIIKPTSTERLFIVPAGESLTELEINLNQALARENRLKMSLKQTKSLNSFDVVLIDNPPFISITTLNSLVASDYYLVPLSCEYLPMLGFKWLTKTVGRVVDVLNPQLKPLGVLLTMYDQRQSITKTVEKLVKDELGDMVFDTKIRINTKHKAAPAYQMTIFQYEGPKGKGSEDYLSLSKEAIPRLFPEYQFKALQEKGKKALQDKAKKFQKVREHEV